MADAAPVAELVPADSLRFPGRPSFTAIAADAIEQFPGIDAALRTAQGDLGGDGVPDFGDLEGALAAAGDADEEAPGSDFPGTLDQAVTAGANVDTLRSAVIDALPSVDTPLSMDFIDPPSAPTTSPRPAESDKNPPDPEVLDS